MIRHKCPDCGVELESPSELAGGNERCTTCNCFCTVPTQSDAQNQVLLGGDRETPGQLGRKESNLRGQMAMMLSRIATAFLATKKFLHAHARMIVFNRRSRATNKRLAVAYRELGAAASEANEIQHLDAQAPVRETQRQLDEAKTSLEAKLTDTRRLQANLDKAQQEHVQWMETAKRELRPLLDAEKAARAADATGPDAAKKELERALTRANDKTSQIRQHKDAWKASRQQLLAELKRAKADANQASQKVQTLSQDLDDKLELLGKEAYQHGNDTPALNSSFAGIRAVWAELASVQADISACQAESVATARPAKMVLMVSAGLLVCVIAVLTVLVAGSTQNGHAESSPRKELTLDLGNNVTMKLVLIPAGKFMMGSPKDEKNPFDDERPQHEVTISKPFYMGIYVVTQEQYKQIIGKNLSIPKGAQNPVGAVSWNEAMEFCTKLSVKTGKTISLPSEAQWEYACRAGSTTRFSFGDDYSGFGNYAWYLDNSECKPHPVGQKQPNAWGLYDMYGNVDQWCSDWYDKNYYANSPKIDPQGPASGTNRVLRGGSFIVIPQLCLSAHRNNLIPDRRSYAYGFRVVVDVSKQGQNALATDGRKVTHADGAPQALPTETQVQDVSHNPESAKVNRDQKAVALRRFIERFQKVLDTYEQRRIDRTLNGTQSLALNQEEVDAMENSLPTIGGMVEQQCREGLQCIKNMLEFQDPKSERFTASMKAMGARGRRSPEEDAAWVNEQKMREVADFSSYLAKAHTVLGQLIDEANKLESGSAITPGLLGSQSTQTNAMSVSPSDTAVGKELTLDLGNNVTMKLALIPAGKFMMGSPKDEKGRKDDEGPQHQVTISKPFYMAIYPVTQEQWTAIMGTRMGIRPWDGYEPDGATHAASNISWDDATAFCNKLSAKTGKAVSLPTEARWEYACRAGSTTRFYYGDDDNYSKLGEYAWYKKNPEDNGESHPHSVGQKKPNAWGLYDMHGNIYEWCADFYSKDYYELSAAEDPTGPSGLYNFYHVMRGSFCSFDERSCRSACRSSGIFNRGWGFYGFRVVVDLNKQDLDTLATRTNIKTKTTSSEHQKPIDPIRRSTAEDKGLTLDLSNKVTMQLALIPAGQFMMGSPKDEKERDGDEGPQHGVMISKPLYMGITHVTVGQFAVFVKDSGYKTDAEKEGWSYVCDGSKFDKVNGASWKTPGFPQTDDHPVVCVSHNDAVEFCKWLSNKTNKAVTLPTESQWEYACRGGTKTVYPWGNSPDDGKCWANCIDQTAKKAFGEGRPSFNWDDGYAFTSPVGKFKANDFGLYDMIGNACEWCSDWHDAGYYANAKPTDPQGPASGTDRVVRGGCWYYAPSNCRSAYRGRFSPVIRNNVIGFRVVVDLK